MTETIPGLLQAFSLVPEGRKSTLKELARLSRMTLSGSVDVASLVNAPIEAVRRMQAFTTQHEFLERLVAVHDLCKENMEPGEPVPEGLDEDISALRRVVRSRYPTLWERLDSV